MSKPPLKKALLSLQPLVKITIVSSNSKSEEIHPESINLNLVGQKAFGLAAIPVPWGLPFIVVSKTFLSGYRTCKNETQFVSAWANEINLALLRIGFKQGDFIIVRSSACGEGMEERGRFHSSDGSFENLSSVLKDCLDKTTSDKDLNNQEIPFVVQKYVRQPSAKGHLSNERRFFEEKRDWFGEIENIDINVKKPFQINLRNWRENINLENLLSQGLACKVNAYIPDALELPARWASSLGLRLHFEWVWDGKTVYLVQADEERDDIGEDPSALTQGPGAEIVEFNPTCLKLINNEYSGQYHKIHNINVYNKLSLPTADLYILDNQEIILGIAAGEIPPGLKQDLEALTAKSLVIRTDLEINDADAKQLLPRTNEVRTVEAALDFLVKTSKALKAKFKDVNLAFLFHNFIPSSSSAFAYAAPGERKVQIEALWGLPEGLYYNAHDKYVVDTLSSSFDKKTEDNLDKFVVKEMRNFKNFFVTPNHDGSWAMKRIRATHAWKGAIQKQEWIKRIALDSRKIAELEGKPLSIMWFVGVPKAICDRQVFPWYHEVYDIKITRNIHECRSKTTFDKALEIKTKKDVEKLSVEAEKESSHVRLIQIQPHEDDLLREKFTLHEIGKLAKKIGATIRLEGGLLSHAYYQLVKTGATVEVVFPFKDPDDKREFNKLVRDKIPAMVEEGGEIVKTLTISGEDFLRALRDKLIEESFETLDASGKESILSELVDVNEVIDGILKHIGMTREELKKKQDLKREKVGGFDAGVVLVKTHNPLPAEKNSDSNEGLLFKLPLESTKDLELEAQKILDAGHAINKWNDKKRHSDSDEYVLRIVAPAVADKWEAHTSESIFDDPSNSPVRAKLSGHRVGSKYQVELSIFSKHKSEKLL